MYEDILRYFGKKYFLTFVYLLLLVVRNPEKIRQSQILMNRLLRKPLLNKIY